MPKSSTRSVTVGIESEFAILKKTWASSLHIHLSCSVGAKFAFEENSDL